MVDEGLILSIERLRDELGNFKTSLRLKYPRPERQVVDDRLRQDAARLAEIWIVSISQREEVSQVVQSDYFADLNVHFQRLLIFSEHASQRTRYDTEINSILKNITINLIIPLKKLRTKSSQAQNVTPVPVEKPQVMKADSSGNGKFSRTVFVGHSFAENDKIIVDCVIETLSSLGLDVKTGEKPRPEKISEKIKRLIEEQHLFVGVFTRRDKIARKKEWTTSPWVIDEKAYALAKGKKLILLKEEGVESIGGLQGDYEFIEFSRDSLEIIPIKLISMFNIDVSELR